MNRLCLLILMLSASHAWAQTPAVERGGNVVFVVPGEFRPNVDSATESALRNAQDRIREWLDKQQPPVRHVPSIETIRREMNPRPYAPEEEAILNQNDKMYKVTMEVTLTPKLLRDLRERDRVQVGLGILAGLLSILGIVWVVCRLDEWQPGRRGRWLMVSIGALVLLLAAVWRAAG